MDPITVHWQRKATIIRRLLWLAYGQNAISMGVLVYLVAQTR